MTISDSGEILQAQPETGVSGTPDWRAVDWPRRVRAAQLGPDRVSYVDIGEGPAVLLVHGLGGNWTAWLETIPALAEAHRVIAVDLPGFGGSPLLTAGTSIAGYTATLERLFDHLGLDHAVVIGSSLGGWIAADLAQRAPERVERLVLIDAAGIVPTRWERRKALTAMEGAALMAPLAPRFRRAVASRRRLRAAALRYTVARPADLPADLVYMALPTAPDPGFRSALEACKRAWSEDWCERLADVACPTLVVWGELDSLLPVRHGREYARRIPRARLCVVPNAGHLPMLERAGRVNAELARFMAPSNPDANGRGSAPGPADSLS